MPSGIRQDPSSSIGNLQGRQTLAWSPAFCRFLLQPTVQTTVLLLSTIPDNCRAITRTSLTPSFPLGQDHQAKFQPSHINLPSSNCWQVKRSTQPSSLLEHRPVHYESDVLDEPAPASHRHAIAQRGLATRRRTGGTERATMGDRLQLQSWDSRMPGRDRWETQQSILVGEVPSALFD